MASQIHHEFVFLDLEFIGDIRQGADKCRIYEIAAVARSNNRKFQIYVDPCPGEPEIPQPVQKNCFHITRDFIEKNNISNFKIAAQKFLRWIRALKYDRITLISHACFRSDMIVLRHELHNAGMQWPHNVGFCDSLNVIRICIPAATAYNLQSLYETVVGKKMIFPHSAMYDAMALKDIFKHFPYFPAVATVFSINQYPYSLLRGIGAKTELNLVKHGFDPFMEPEQRAQIIHNCSLSPQQTQTIEAATAHGLFKSYPEIPIDFRAEATPTHAVDST